MRIETAVTPGTAAKDKGDLLEELAGKLLRIQNYEVMTQVRKTGSELDLLCKHRISQKQVYVECKALRETLSANVLKHLLGTISFANYQEGWLISAGPLGKDAKGFQHEWETKPIEERQRLSIYTPERVVEALTNSGAIKPAPQTEAIAILGSEDYLGEWTLLITEYGTVWATVCLRFGAPFGVIAFSATMGQLIDNAEHLRHLASTDSSLRAYDFTYLFTVRDEQNTAVSPSFGFEKVVEVQHGENWADYRPARPEDFVGRKDSQVALIRFFRGIRRRATSTRVFAVTGDSGMGKSSLIAKLRQRIGNVRHRRDFFLYAVDVRAATGPEYIHLSLLACLRQALTRGYGKAASEPLRISDHCEPLASPSIKEFIDTLEQNNQVVCLVFDQFEELYSKPELFPVFEEAQRLFLSAVSAQSNLVLGFAWRTDSTVQQDHPAYYMWHRLADHRFEVGLAPFSHSEASTALTLFERELGEKIRPELRRILIESSQGYPWLLKKLSIHLYEQIKLGISQADLVETLDVASLFDRDLKVLTPAENSCLRTIAQGAPADWYETLEAFGNEVLRALQDKRLIVRSGDRINLYWDIFREYVLTKNVPSIPFSYLPSSPSLVSLLAVADKLTKEHTRTFSELADGSGLSEKTLGNVARDLIMFGIATSSQGGIRLDQAMPLARPKDSLERIRHVLKRHGLTLKLARFDDKSPITLNDIIRFLKQLNPAAKHRSETWVGYAERMANWLTTCGLLEANGNTWIRRDKGEVVLVGYKGRRRREVFTGCSPPAKVAEAYEWLIANQPQSIESITQRRYRNAFVILSRFGFVERDDSGGFISKPHHYEDTAAALWHAAHNEETVNAVIDYLENRVARRGTHIGKLLNNKYQSNWSVASEKRIGDGLLHWASWVIQGVAAGTPPPPPGPRSMKKKQQTQGPEQQTFFNEPLDS
jgi:Restriction endonuclease/KAP family P-loop domain